MSWTDERVERLKQLWADGLSASQIAAQLGGISRNAVIGKVHRLNLPGRAKSGGSSVSRSKRSGTAPRSSYSPRASSPRPVMRTSGATALKQEIVADAVSEIDTRPIEDVVVPIYRKLELTELTEQTCKWPVGDPLQEDFYFCGSDCEETGPYCNYHSKLAFQPAGERRRPRN